MVTVDLEVITLTGVYIYQKDKKKLEKRFFPWSEECMPPPEFLKKVRETQQPTNNFLNSIMKQELKPDCRPKAPCSCPFKLNRNQQEHNAPLLILTVIHAHQLG